jgi:hypothetical protein
MKRKAGIFSITIGLLLLVFICIIVALTEDATILQISSTITATPFWDKTATATKVAWSTKQLRPYKANVVFPDGWEFTVTNIRSEPTGLEGLGMGHECVDFVLSDPSGTQKFTINMPCAMDEGNPATCPPEITFVEMLEGNAELVRYFDETKYNYTVYYSSNQSCINPPAIMIPDGMAHVYYTGNNPEIADLIVRSLFK